jgi:hypothetical protein
MRMIATPFIHSYQKEISRRGFGAIGAAEKNKTNKPQ